MQNAGGLDRLHMELGTGMMGMGMGMGISLHTLHIYSHAVLCFALLCMLWFGLVWFGLLWFALVCFGLVCLFVRKGASMLCAGECFLYVPRTNE